MQKTKELNSYFATIFISKGKCYFSNTNCKQKYITLGRKNVGDKYKIGNSCLENTTSEKDLVEFIDKLNMTQQCKYSRWKG